MDKVLQYLKTKEQKLCVLSTVSPETKPEAAVVGYAIKDDLKIIISTHPSARKVINIKQNNHVALVFGWSFQESNIQYEGTAMEIVSENLLYKQTDEFFFTQNPHAKAFRTPDTIFFEISPKWIRHLDLSQTPPRTEEFTL